MQIQRHYFFRYKNPQLTSDVILLENAQLKENPKILTVALKRVKVIIILMTLF